MLSIRPGVQAGHVCIEGTRVTAETVGGRVFAGETVDLVADDLRVTRKQVLLCCWWWAREQRFYRSKYAKSVVARWGDWGAHAGRVLGGWERGRVLEDPPA